MKGKSQKLRPCAWCGKRFRPKGSEKYHSVACKTQARWYAKERISGILTIGAAALAILGLRKRP